MGHPVGMDPSGSCIERLGEIGSSEGFLWFVLVSALNLERESIGGGRGGGENESIAFGVTSKYARNDASPLGVHITQTIGPFLSCRRNRAGSLVVWR